MLLAGEVGFGRGIFFIIQSKVEIMSVADFKEPKCSWLTDFRQYLNIPNSESLTSSEDRASREWDLLDDTVIYS